jgi:hypothetical protein
VRYNFWYEFDNQCDRRNCPARGTVVVMIHGQDFKFCQHDYNELEATLLTIDPAPQLVGVE